MMNFFSPDPESGSTVSSRKVFEHPTREDFGVARTQSATDTVIVLLLAAKVLRTICDLHLQLIVIFSGISGIRFCY